MSSAQANELAEIVRIYFKDEEWDWLLRQDTFRRAINRGDLDQKNQVPSLKVQLVRLGVDLLEKRRSDN
jgi:hypothetical protein